MYIVTNELLITSRRLRRVSDIPRLALLAAIAALLIGMAGQSDLCRIEARRRGLDADGCRRLACDGHTKQN